jgi:hypothetical protein
MKKIEDVDAIQGHLDNPSDADEAWVPKSVGSQKAIFNG